MQRIFIIQKTSNNIWYLVNIIYITWYTIVVDIPYLNTDYACMGDSVAMHECNEFFWWGGIHKYYRIQCMAIVDHLTDNKRPSDFKTI